jgi:hypothetical protein
MRFFQSCYLMCFSEIILRYLPLLISFYIFLSAPLGNAKIFLEKCYRTHFFSSYLLDIADKVFTTNRWALFIFLTSFFTCILVSTLRPQTHCIKSNLIHFELSNVIGALTFNSSFLDDLSLMRQFHWLIQSESGWI